MFCLACPGQHFSNSTIWIGMNTCVIIDVCAYRKKDILELLSLFNHKFNSIVLIFSKPYDLGVSLDNMEEIFMFKTLKFSSFFALMCNSIIAKQTNRSYPPSWINESDKKRKFRYIIVSPMTLPISEMTHVNRLIYNTDLNLHSVQTILEAVNHISL
jgi:hypothetical protein